MRLLTGKRFNELYKGTEFVKLTTKTENHNGLVYGDGPVSDPVPFCPAGKCVRGGMYFCVKSKLTDFLFYSTKPMKFCRRVIIPNDANVYDEGNKFKTDKFILGPRISIIDLDIWNDEKLCEILIKKDPRVLKYIKNQDQLALKNILRRMDGRLIKYVRNQTDILCWEALRECAGAIKFIKNPTLEMQLYAVSKCGNNLQYINNPTNAIVEAAFEQSVFVIQYIKNPSQKMINEAALRCPRLNKKDEIL